MTRDEMLAEYRATGMSEVYLETLAVAYALGAQYEREACAKLCEEQGSGRRALEHYAALTYSGAAFECAVAIRARGDT